MSTDLENLTANFGLLKREFRDVHAVVSRLDTQVRRLVEPVAIHRPAGLVARYAACTLIALKAKRSPEAIATQHFAADRDLARLIELKAAVTPAMTGVAGWASELAAVVVVDIATNLLPASALAQLRAASGQDYAFIDGAVARVPVHTPTPSRGFVAEGGAIPVGALIIAALGLKPKKAGSITAITKELAAGLPLNVELSLQTLLSQDLGLAIDAVLLGSAAATPDAPAGLLAGVTPLTATAGGGAIALLGDIKKLIGAIAPALRPVLICNSVQSASTATLSQSPLPVIAAPYLPADQIVAVDAAAFASALGVPSFRASASPTLHMETAPLRWRRPVRQQLARRREARSKATSPRCGQFFRAIGRCAAPTRWPSSTRRHGRCAMLTELDSIKAAISDDALFQRALTDFIETAVRITVVGHSLPAATVELDHLREQLLERIDHGRPTLAIRRGKSGA